jgi:adenylylsulfate kinase-like enzyme
MPDMRVPVLLITGPVGVGKSSVLGEITEILEGAGVSFAAVDLDALSWCYPSPPGDDRFRSGLALRNLAAIWRNFRAAGAERLVLARVIESRDELARYRKAIPGAGIVVVRLAARLRTLQARAKRREIGLGRAWHVRRAAELARIMDRAAVEDVRIETDGRTVNAIAREILDRVGWLRRRRHAATRTRPGPSRRSAG